MRRIRPIYIILVVLALLGALIWIGLKYLKPYLQNRQIEVITQNYQQGKELSSRGQWQEAEKYLQKAVNAEPSNASYIRELAVAKYNLEDFQVAINLYEELLKINPQDAFAYNGIANAYRDWASVSVDKQQEYQEKAIEAYEQAISVNENYTVSYNNLSLLLQDLGRKKEAIEVLEEGIEANPTSEELKNSLKVMKGK